MPVKGEESRAAIRARFCFHVFVFRKIWAVSLCNVIHVQILDNICTNIVALWEYHGEWRWECRGYG
jgi:hypothetical protein